MITSVDFAIISLMIFAVGIFGILFNKKNLLIMLMSIEIILLGANMNFCASLWDCATVQTSSKRKWENSLQILNLQGPILMIY